MSCAFIICLPHPLSFPLLQRRGKLFRRGANTPLKLPLALVKK